MRVSQPGQARALHYDRNPSAIVRLYNATIAPAGATIRWTYTVPANRKLLLEHVLAFILRITVAAPVGEAECWIWSDGAGAFHALAGVMTNAVGDRDRDSSGESAVLGAGVVIDARTQDGSTGGTVEFALSMRGTEFDA